MSTFNIEGNVKFRAGKYLIPGKITKVDKRLYIEFRYNAFIKDEIKVMEGHKWHGFDESNPQKIWSVNDSERNRFQLAYLIGLNPYAKYDLPLIDYKSKRKAYNHQCELTAHGLTVKHGIWAAEPGTGKTLAAIELIEATNDKTVLWVGPKSALSAVKLEFFKWNAKIWPEFITYESLKKLVETWPKGKPAPRTLILDECQKVKNYTAKRSLAAQYIADSMRAEYGDNCYIILMSGTPAPKDPTDWYSICNIACPGFLREGDIYKFKQRLALIGQGEGLDGGRYPKLITWLDDEKKCKICGKLENDADHDSINMIESWYHNYEKSTNEIANLYKRMKGLVVVKFKKDLLDLPEKIYRQWVCKPSRNTLNAAKLITASSDNSLKAAILLRELSDGFQYVKVEEGKQNCPICLGSSLTDEFYDLDEPDYQLDRKSIELGHRVIYNENNEQIDFNRELLKLGKRKVACLKCKNGKVPRYKRDIAEVECPKDEAVIDLLEMYEDYGRTIFWAGFQGSVDKITKLIIKQGWEVIRLDGRGWWSSLLHNSSNDLQLLRIYQEQQDIYSKVAFVGQPGAGGLGLTLTASCMEAFYSNTFKADDRWQAIDRIHRPGADHNRGVTIWDIVHLPSDLLVIDNLDKKKDLQELTMGQFKEVFETVDLEERTN